jgi:hypothetical protein
MSFHRSSGPDVSSGTRYRTAMSYARRIWSWVTKVTSTMKLVTAAGTVRGLAPSPTSQCCRDGGGVGAGRQPTLECRVSSRHLDSLVNDSVRRDALMHPFEVLPVDLLCVRAQGVREEMGEPSTRLDVVRATAIDELAQFSSFVLDDRPVGILILSANIGAVDRCVRQGRSSKWLLLCSTAATFRSTPLIATRTRSAANPRVDAEPGLTDAPRRSALPNNHRYADHVIFGLRRPLTSAARMHFSKMCVSRYRTRSCSQTRSEIQ